MKIGVVILATNAYFPLGIRFVKRFMNFYEGGNEVTFHFFSDRNPADCLPENINFRYYPTENKTWVEGTNLKFNSILSINSDDDFLYYFDADTNVSQPFGDWFLGDLVGGRHFADHVYNPKPFERNPASNAFVPLTDKPQMYYYGAFFGGRYARVKDFCFILKCWQDEDHAKGIEAVWNDESYINRYFYYEPPKVIMCEDFPFKVSDKGGIGETRDMGLNVEKLITDLRDNRDKQIDIINGNVVLLD